jgi:hypothetical protein
MARPSARADGTSEVWSSGEYRNYVRNMMTNFGSQYNRRREAENSATEPGRRSSSVEASPRLYRLSFMSWRRMGGEEVNSTHLTFVQDRCRSWGSSVSIVSDYRLDDRVSILGKGKGFFHSPPCPDRLWGLPSLVSKGYRGPFPVVKSCQGLTLTTHPQLLRGQEWVGAASPVPLGACMASNGTVLLNLLEQQVNYTRLLAC